jgi:hypothetical protein
MARAGAGIAAPQNPKASDICRFSTGNNATGPQVISGPIPARTALETPCSPAENQANVKAFALFVI